MSGNTKDHYFDNRSWADGYVSTLNTGAQGFIDAVTAIAIGGIDSIALGTIHFFRDGAALAPPVFDPFIGASAQKRLCTQRRRLGSEF